MKNRNIGRRFVLCSLLATTFVVPAVRAQHGHASGELRVEQPWSRATAGAAKTGAGYLKITNRSAQPDRLVEASSPVAGRMELHEMTTVGNVMQMRPLKDGIPVPGAGSVELKPGGLHLMFIDLKTPLVRGTKVPVTLRFEKGGEMKVELDVRDLREGAPTGHSH